MKIINYVFKSFFYLLFFFNVQSILFSKDSSILDKYLDNSQKEYTFIKPSLKKEFYSLEENIIKKHALNTIKFFNKQLIRVNQLDISWNTLNLDILATTHLTDIKIYPNLLKDKKNERFQICNFYKTINRRETRVRHISKRSIKRVLVLKRIFLETILNNVSKRSKKYLEIPFNLEMLKDLIKLRKSLKLKAESEVLNDLNQKIKKRFALLKLLINKSRLKISNQIYFELNALESVFNKNEDLKDLSIRFLLKREIYESLYNYKYIRALLHIQPNYVKERKVKDMKKLISLLQPIGEVYFSIYLKNLGYLQEAKELSKKVVKLDESNNFKVLSKYEYWLIDEIFSKKTVLKKETELSKVFQKDEFVKINPGSFLMGTNLDQTLSYQHKVTISKPFEISKYELTQEQYYKILGPHLGRGRGVFAESSYKSSIGIGDQLPAYFFNWGDVKKLLITLNKLVKTCKTKDTIDMMSKDLSKIDNGCFRIPTEAEWEYVSRAGTKAFYFYDENKNGIKHIIESSKYSWFNLNSSNRLHPVGLLKPNPWGLYDIYGNVSELTFDQYLENSKYWIVYPKEALVDPISIDNGKEGLVGGVPGGWKVKNQNPYYRITKGGSIYSKSDKLALNPIGSPSRLEKLMKYRKFVGIRLVRVISN